MKIKAQTYREQLIRRRHSKYQNVAALTTLFLILLVSSLLIGKESNVMHSIRGERDEPQPAIAADHDTGLQMLPQHTNSSHTQQKYQNQFALSPGELPGYTGWARPEQTLAGYFDITSLSHPSLPQELHMKYHSVIKSGDKFSLLLTCNHNRTSSIDIDSEPPYECPPDGGTLFYVRAYGPSVLAGDVNDYHNASYSVEVQFIDPGEYTLEVVVTFSVPLEFDGRFSRRIPSLVS